MCIEGHDVALIVTFIMYETVAIFFLYIKSHFCDINVNIYIVMFLRTKALQIFEQLV